MKSGLFSEVPQIQRSLTGDEIICAKVFDRTYTVTDPEIHSDGEYSIEVVLRKK